MKRNRFPLHKYLLGLSLAFLAVSNCFNVSSNSSSLTAFPVADGPDLKAAKSPRNSHIVGSPVAEGRRESNFSPVELVTRAAMVLPAASPFAPAITATKSHMLAPGDTQADPGDTLTYSVIITNSGTSDATGVNFSDTIDPNTTLVAGSVIASPIAIDDSYHTIGNVNISVPVAQGVIANDLNPNGSGTLTVTRVNAVVVPGGGSATASTASGSVTMNSDGSFSYTPNAGFRGPTDTFTYTLDNGTGKTDTATVTIAVSGLIWFVNSSAAINGDGRLNSPFNCLVGAGCYSSAASAANDNIFVYSGSYTGGLTLLNGQKLIGQGAGDTLLNITGLTAPSGTNLLPSTGGANPTIAAAGADVTLASGNTIRGVALNGAAASAVDLTGTGFGTVTIAETSLDGTGQALNLNTGTLSGPVAATAAFTSVSSANSSTTGISLQNVSGNMASGSTSISGSSSIGISVDTSSAALNFGTTSSTTSGGAGISLTTNTGTITFGAVTITPNANQEGLLATNNSNTITITGGSISSSGAAAVDIARSSGTTPLVISLTSVSANGGANGISLSNTSGSFTVTGDGSNNGSGGTIQNNTADGISLTNAQNVSLTSMSIQNSTHSGINGTAVNNFSFTFGTINNSGTTDHDSNIAFKTNPTTANNIAGTLTVTNSTLTNALYSGVNVESANGTVTNATISNNTITSTTSTTTSQGFGINFVGLNTATTVFNLNKATISNNTISNFPSASGIQISLSSSTVGGPGATAGIPNDATNVISITNNMIRGNSPLSLMGGSAIVVAVASANSTARSRANFDISNNGTLLNPLTNIGGNVIGVGCNGYTTMTATVNNNVIVANHVPNLGGPSGISGGNGTAGAGNLWTPALTLTVTGNTVSQTDGNGMLLVSRGTHGQMDLKVANNTVAAPINVGGAARQGIRVDAGNSSTADDAVCLNIFGNTSVGSNGATGIGLRKQGTVPTTNDFGIQGIPQNPPTNTDVVNYVNAQNPTGGGTTIISGSGFVQCGTAPASIAPEPMAKSVPATTDAADEDAGVSGTMALALNKLITLEADRNRLGIGEGVELSGPELRWMVQAALERWREAGVSAADMERLQQVDFEIASLPTEMLAQARGTHVTIDATAGSLGWYYDQTPQEDSEFAVPVPGRELQATEASLAFGRVDLLTVVMRELGQVYLQGQERVPKQFRWMMQPLLPAGVRRMPLVNSRPISAAIRANVPNRAAASTVPSQPVRVVAVSPIPAVFNPSTDLMPGALGRIAKRMGYAASARPVAAFIPAPSGETVNLNVGTIPPGKSVTIMFQVTINNPLPAGICTITNVGHVTGSNFSPVDTNSDVTPIAKAVTIGACPANITTNTDPGVCTAVVNYTTPTGDGCPVPTVTCNPASGSAFAKGTTTVTCTASNGNPPDATCSFTVTVNDNQPPTITCPANVTQSTDPNQCSAVVTYSNATATDNCPGVGTPVCTPASGSTFAKGTTTVNCTVSDSSGNSANCSFTVTVNDTQAPTITCPANVTKSTDPDLCTAVVTYPNATATDNCSGVGTPTCTPPSGSTFAKGTTTVNCSVSDASGNPASCSFTVTVKDTQAPTMSPCPSNISVVSSGGCQVVNYPTPTAHDNCGSATVTCSPPSGTCFPPGTTTVTCTASDDSPDSPDSSCSFTVTVVPCAITCPSNIDKNNDPGQCGAVVTFAPTTTGGGCGTVTCNPSSGSFFPVGTTTVTCSTQAGPSCSFTVTVHDTEAPVITTTSGTIELWPPNHQYQTVTMSQLVASATDNCDGNVFSRVVIASVSSDEAENAPGDADGNTINDIVIAADCKSVQLRAERDTDFNGRVYTIVLRVRDAAGNVGTASRTVIVPLDQSGGGAILGPGPGYTVTSGCP
jgi:HYR domain/Bacterial Ig domain